MADGQVNGASPAVVGLQETLERVRSLASDIAVAVGQIEEMEAEKMRATAQRGED